jgi:hypothetical protein
MKLTDLRRLTRKELKSMERFNKLSFHSMMLTSVVLFARAFSEINPLFLLFSFGLVLVSQSFYANAKLIRNLQQTGKH